MVALLNAEASSDGLGFIRSDSDETKDGWTRFHLSDRRKTVMTGRGGSLWRCTIRKLVSEVIVCGVALRCMQFHTH